MKTEHFDVIILGAGAAGLMCAIEAGKRQKSVLILEHNEKEGKKIKISGGGRCNFTNLHTKADHYICSNPHFVKSALARFTPKKFIQLVKKHKIKFHEKKLGQLFCDTNAQQIIDLLKEECAENNVRILTNTSITSAIHQDQFQLTSKNQNFLCQSLVVATGGLSIPSLGTSDFGYKIARQFKIKIIEQRPGLVPLTFRPKELEIFKSLSGLSIDVEVSYQKQTFRENMLLTHRGISGPAILQISSYWKPNTPLKINLLPEIDILKILQKSSQKNILMKTILSRFFPKRFADVFANHYLNNRELNQYSPKELKEVATLLHNWEITPNKTEGYKKAEVTLGGIDTNELSSKTFESKKTPGLYFIGEVLDVTGHLGGFNFQWAWASGYCAGQSV